LGAAKTTKREKLRVEMGAKLIEQDKRGKNGNATVIWSCELVLDLLG